MIPKGDWKWFGHAAHFICAEWCRFHMATQVGNYIVSTVGEYWPPRTVREIHASSRDAEWFEENRHLLGDYFDAAYMKRFGFHEIGYKRKYETMVFEAGKPCAEEFCNCGLPTISGTEIAFNGYSTAGDAARGHLALREKFARERQGGSPS